MSSSKPSENLERLKAVQKGWNDTKGGNLAEWEAMFADNIRVRTVGNEPPGLAFARECLTKKDAMVFLTSMLKDWTMVHWTPETYVEDGDQIAVFGRCAWTHKATGKMADVLISDLWRFEDGKAVEFTEIFDTARAAAAAIPG